MEAESSKGAKFRRTEPESPSSAPLLRRPRGGISSLARCASRVRQTVHLAVSGCSLLVDGPGEGLAALLWIVASELGDHRAAAAEPFVAAGAAHDLPRGALDQRMLRR